MKRAISTVTAAVIAVFLFAGSAHATLAAPSATQTSYVVRSGDTLGSIAGSTGLSISRLVWLNRIPDRNYIVTGARLRLVLPRATKKAVAPSIAIPVGSSSLPATGTPPAAATAASAPLSTSGVNWDAIANCESGGRWNLDSTYDGGLQFLPSTWLNAGGGKYAQYAWQATREEQIAVAEYWVTQIHCIQCRSGWPVCGKYA